MFSHLGGFFQSLLVALVGFVFRLIAAIKAANGEAWQYPLTLRLIK